MQTELDNPFLASASDVAAGLGVDVGTGLTDDEVRRRLHTYGPNALAERAPVSLWSIVLAQFNSLVIYLLLAASVVAFLFEETVEGFAILIVILINAAVGFTMEVQATRSMAALRKLARVHARVRRNGQVRDILSDDLVPGDVLLIEAGDVIAADARVYNSARLEVDESALTGESVPVAKTAEALSGDVVLAERRNMLFRGTAVTRGNAEAVVVATGMQTELGAISELVETAEQEATPLEEKLEAFGRRLVWLTLVLAAAIIVLGIVQGDELFLVVETAIALSVAAIPEGLPIVATIALARGMIRMAKRNVIVRRLASVETLGGTNVICTDKTGTLTENRLSVSRVEFPGGELDADRRNGALVLADDSAATDEVFRRIVAVMRLCNNATYDAGTGTGDPLEVALLKFAAETNSRIDTVADEWPRVDEEPFDSDTKIMVTVHDSGEEIRLAAKGAPEAILERCSAVAGDGEHTLTPEMRQQWLQRADALSADGLRVLAFADRFDADRRDRLVFLGLVGFLDPPRDDVAPALRECARAGIRVVMVTGDHPATAKAIAAKVHLIDDSASEPVLRGERVDGIESLSDAGKEEVLRTRVFARVTPQQKLRLVEFYQKHGHIVAMTGDGVNDAPALRKADIGIAMGQRGTQIAREAATMVLQDDAFTSIVEAVRQGRIIFNNIRKFVIYLLSCNISEIFVVAGATFAGLPLPLLPLQILFLNLVTDVFPALALGVGPGDHSVMNHKPRRPDEPILSRKYWIAISVYGGMMTLSGLAVVFYCDNVLRMDELLANNVAFLSLTLAQLWHVFNIAPRHQSFLANDVTRNGVVWLALVVCLLIVAAAYLIAPVRTALSLTTEAFAYWPIVALGSVAPLLASQVLKRLKVIW